MTTHAKGDEWLPRPMAVAAIVAAALGLAVHAAIGFRGAYLAYGSGAWLTLARDLADGVFYRDLIADAGYGGTRYFPLFFGAIGFFIKLGVPIVVAGWLTGSIALAILVSGTYRAARVTGSPPLVAAVFAAGPAAAYFTQQTLFEIRADVMAAGFNLWGIALLLRAWTSSPPTRVRTGLAALWFTLAFATKVTSLAVPFAMIAAALLTRRGRLAAALARNLIVGVGVFLAAVQLASGGRALRVWAACLFAGSDAGSTVSRMLAGDFLVLVRYSHVIAALAAVTAAGLLLSAILRSGAGTTESRAGWVVPASLWAGASAAAALTLASPGTVPTNQMIEWIAASFVVLAMVARSIARVRKAVAIVAVLFVVWMSAQDVLRASERRRMWTADIVRDQAQLIERLQALPSPFLAESALWPILAGREVVVPDAFAARVVMQSRPDIEQHLLTRINRREFSAVVLEFDPDSPEGPGVYERVHFGSPVVEAVKRGYRLEKRFLDNAFVWVPRD